MIFDLIELVGEQAIAIWVVQVDGATGRFGGRPVIFFSSCMGFENRRRITG